MISLIRQIVGGSQRGGKVLANGFIYETMAGDTFDSISLDFYDDEHYSSEIIQANSNYRNTIIFSGGEVLEIPIIEDKTNNSLPPWKQG